MVSAANQTEINVPWSLGYTDTIDGNDSSLLLFPLIKSCQFLILSHLTMPRILVARIFFSRSSVAVAIALTEVATMLGLHRDCFLGWFLWVPAWNQFPRLLGSASWAASIRVWGEMGVKVVVIILLARHMLPSIFAPHCSLRIPCYFSKTRMPAMSGN